MEIRIRNGIIYGDYDQILGTIIDGVSPAIQDSIEAGSEALTAIDLFVKDVNKGSMKPRAATKRFESILEKYSIKIED